MVPRKILGMVILERLIDIGDKQIRDEHAGFRHNRPKTLQIVTLRIRIQQIQ